MMYSKTVSIECPFCEKHALEVEFEYSPPPSDDFIITDMFVDGSDMSPDSWNSAISNCPRFAEWLYATSMEPANFLTADEHRKIESAVVNACQD